VSAPQPVNEMTAVEFNRTVVGGERDMVTRTFKSPLGMLSRDDPYRWIQALVYLDLHRRREPDPQAKAAAMTNGELEDYFAATVLDADGEVVDDSGEA